LSRQKEIPTMSQTITRAELQTLIRDRAVTVVEALPIEYYRKAHLPGALHLPHTEVAALAPEVLPERDAAIVVYCASDTCSNSDIAARALVSLGYANVRVYVEGKKGWIEAGNAVESGRPASRAA
jgi:rhodanese-related sulfurtransferase